jgi:hypothetical protein
MGNAGKIVVELGVDYKGEVTLKEFEGDLARLGLKTDKAFSKGAASAKKMNNAVSDSVATVKNLVGAYVSLHSAIALYDTAKFGAKVQQEADAFKNLTAAHGISSALLIDQLKTAAGEAISTSEVIQKAGTAIMLGVSGEKTVKLMEIARSTARMTGQTIADAFNSLSLGTARMSRLLLDNTGIIVSVTEANEKYAQSVGGTVSALSDQEKRLAFINEIVSKGDSLISRLGGSTATASEKFQEFEATLGNVKASIGGLLTTAFIPLVEQLGAASAAMDKLLNPDVGTVKALDKEIRSIMDSMEKGTNWFDKTFYSKDVAQSDKLQAERLKRLIDQRQQLILKSIEEEGQLKKNSEELKKQIKIGEEKERVAQETLEFNKKKAIFEKKFTEQHIKLTSKQYDYELELLKRNRDQAVKFGMGEAKINEVFMVQKLALDQKYADITSKEKEKLHQDELKRKKEEIKAEQEVAKAAYIKLQTYDKVYTEINNKSAHAFEVRKQLLKAEHDNLVKILGDSALAWQWYMEKMEEEWIKQARAGDVFVDGMKAKLIELQDEFLTFGEAGYQAMETLFTSATTTFESIFYDGMTGQLDSLGEYWDSFCQSILKKIAQLAAQLATQELIVPIVTKFLGGSSGATGLVSDLLGGQSGGYLGGQGQSGIGSSILSEGVGWIGDKLGISGLLGGGAALAGTGLASMGGGVGVVSGDMANWAVEGVGQATSGSSLGGLLGSGSVLGKALPIAGIALGGYNMISNAFSDDPNKLTGALSGASAGAGVGTLIVPGIGTLIGGLIGGVVGFVSSLFGTESTWEGLDLGLAAEFDKQLGFVPKDIMGQRGAMSLEELKGATSGYYEDVEKFGIAYHEMISLFNDSYITYMETIPDNLEATMIDYISHQPDLSVGVGNKFGELYTMNIGEIVKNYTTQWMQSADDLLAAAEIKGIEAIIGDQIERFGTAQEYLPEFVQEVIELNVDTYEDVASVMDRINDTTLQKYQELFEVLHAYALKSTEMINAAFTTGLKAGDFDVFGDALRDSVYNSIVDGVLMAFSQTSMIQDSLQPLLFSIDTAIAESLSTGVFDAEIFRELIDPQIATVGETISAMEPVFNEMNDVLEHFKTALGLNAELAGEQASVAESILVDTVSPVLDDVTEVLGSLDNAMDVNAEQMSVLSEQVTTPSHTNIVNEVSNISNTVNAEVITTKDAKTWFSDVMTSIGVDRTDLEIQQTSVDTVGI